MAVNSVTSTSSSVASAQPGAAQASNQTVTTTDFMQLLSAEMANQDPLQPMDPTQTMTQLAQFESLQSSNQINENQSLSAANSFIGAQVTIPGTNGQPAVTALVSGVDDSQVASGGQPMLILNGSTQEYPITAASLVTASSPSTPASSAATSSASSSGASSSAAPATPASSGSTSGASSILSSLLPSS